MPMKKPILARFAALLAALMLPAALALFAPSPVRAADEPPAAADAAKVVETLHGALLEVMQHADKLGFSGRVSTLEPVINDSFDFPTIARLVMGRYWRGLKADQQKQFIEVFSRLSVVTYASRFDGYAGETFRMVGQDAKGKDSILVRTELEKSDHSVVSLDYLVHADADNHWRIVNVIADGVSDLSLKRADYGSIMKNDGYVALISKLNDKIAQYEKPSGGK
jgi:phospholipid transport system substrate-binding protein